MIKRFLYILCLVSIGGAAYGKLSATSFPGTAADLSFKSRIENLRDGYVPFMDKSAYRALNIEPGEEIYTDHMIAREEADYDQQEQDKQTLSLKEYCEKYPYDEEKCPTEPTRTEQPTIAQIEIPEIPGPTDTNKDKTEKPILPIQPIQNENVYSGTTIGGGRVVENNYVVGGSCYPADHDRHFVNKVMTTGKYEKIHPAFEKGLISVFRKEGSCGTIKNDPCGYTCYGIGSSPRCAGVRVSSRAEAEDIYYTKYWKPLKLEKLPDVIATDIFLASMASGPGTALSKFRQFLGLKKKTSPVDAEMINAVNNYPGDIHNDWMNVRDSFLQDVARRRYGGSVSRGYKNSIELKRKNGCHVHPQQPLYR